MRCPLCASESRRVHSHYERRLRDLPLGEYAVELSWRVRKYVCERESCPRKIYAERLPEVAGYKARRTKRLEKSLVQIGVEVGGAAGERLSRKLGYRISDSSLLYLLRQQPLPEPQAIKALGVDDFAFRKGQRYGTILVDLEAGQVIELLADREAETLSRWLEEHPGIEWLTRDRSAIYRKGMSSGAAEAQQVVDRFHLLQNLLEFRLRPNCTTCDSGAISEQQKPNGGVKRQI